MDDKDWELFKQKLNRKTGIDLQLYKEQQMRRSKVADRFRMALPKYAQSDTLSDPDT